MSADLALMWPKSTRVRTPDYFADTNCRLEIAAVLGAIEPASNA